MDLTLLTSRLKSDYPVTLEPSVEMHPQTAATLVMLYWKHRKIHVLLIERSRTLRKHAGEIGFPGGVYEEEDENLLITSVRETKEEVGVDVDPSSIVGRLPTVLTLTEFSISPFVVFLDTLPPTRRNRAEVSQILEVPLVSLLSTQHRDVGYPPEKEMWVYIHGSHRIWGATARILHKLSELI